MGENSAMSLKDLIFEMTGQVVAASLLVDNHSAVSKFPRPSGVWLKLKRCVVHQRRAGTLLCMTYVPTAIAEGCYRNRELDYRYLRDGCRYAIHVL
jgi:hypothetical protein